MILSPEVLVAAVTGAWATIGIWLQTRHTNREVRKIATQVQPNGGSSMADAVARIERDVTTIRQVQATIQQTQADQGHCISRHEECLTALKDALRRNHGDL